MKYTITDSECFRRSFKDASTVQKLAFRVSTHQATQQDAQKLLSLTKTEQHHFTAGFLEKVQRIASGKSMEFVSYGKEIRASMAQLRNLKAKKTREVQNG